ncbi:hypothetical protein N7517_008974 [Penicillium concentricum]|uniref:Ecp2 effector protein domain-containing protein n=1 Tax=Penicillium concentricum TaxID=293559 RepID=A0A9W9UW63_9EURO|nr:uncharacterized protein N7517_008974 [Penicillium concentricum]KAJ5359783.1 hypothetical protein N7517_008974 [Penicillium concentricum]
MFPKALLSVGFLLALLGSALALELNIARDLSLGTTQWAYSSKCSFAAPPSDAQFLKMIQVAFDDMKNAPAASNKERSKRPNAMIGLSIGNEVYLSSSVRGTRQIIYEKASFAGGDGTLNPELPKKYKEVTDALAKCATPANKQHKNQAACGEIMSTLMWMTDNPTQSPKELVVQPKVAAFNGKGYLPPCSPDPNNPEDVSWGCDSWTKEMGYKVVGDMSLPDEITVVGTCTGPLSLNACLTVVVDEEEISKG